MDAQTTSSTPPTPSPAASAKQVSSAPPPAVPAEPWSGSEWGDARANAAQAEREEQADRAEQAEQAEQEKQAEQAAAPEPSVPTEPGLADAVVSRVLDAAQSMQESFRPFALKGDVPTASIPWKSWVVRAVSLVALVSVVTLSWFHGARLLERILPPELMPAARPEPEAPRLPAPAQAAPSPAPAPAVPAPAAAPPAVADGSEFALDVRTIPPRASAIIGGETIITPGVVSLGAFLQPAELHIEKLGYQPEVILIDRTGFAPADGRMLRVVSLALRTATAAPAPLDALTPAAPVPAPTPTAPPPPAPTPPAKDSHTTAPSAHKPDAKKPTATKPTPRKDKEPAAKPAAPTPTPGVSPLQAAQACLQRGDNACAVEALSGKARTARELELLVETHRAMGNQVKAWDAMRTYLERFPDEKKAASYSRTLGQ